MREKDGLARFGVRRGHGERAAAAGMQLRERDVARLELGVQERAEQQQALFGRRAGTQEVLERRKDARDRLCLPVKAAERQQRHERAARGPDKVRHVAKHVRAPPAKVFPPCRQPHAVCAPARKAHRVVGRLSLSLSLA